MILRIEDTDIERSEARFEEQLIGDLRWLGIDWDEGPDRGGSYAPYRQSDRLEIYREHAEGLLAEGKAYLCFCSEEELEKERERRRPKAPSRSIPASAATSIPRRPSAAAPPGRLAPSA